MTTPRFSSLADWFRRARRTTSVDKNDPVVRVVNEMGQLADAGNHREVETRLRNLVLARPNDPDPLLLLAAQLVVQGEIEEAAWTAARAADLRKDDPDVVYRAAECVRWFSLPAARDYIEHVKWLVTQANAENAFVFRAGLLALEGFVAFDEGDRDLGVRLLEKGHQVDPTDLFVARNLAEAYLKVGRRAEALALIRDGLRRDPTDRGLLRLIEDDEADFQ